MRILTRRDTGLINRLTFGISAIDPDAEAFFAAAGITDPTQKQAIFQLVTNLKNFGIWTKFNAIYPFVGGTATTHKFNLINPADTNAAFRLNFVGGWNHSSTGALPNGVNSFADTFLTPSTSLQLNSTHVSFYSRTNSTVNDTIDIGTPGLSLYLAAWYFGGANVGIITNINNSGFLGGIANSDSRGFYCSSRTANTTWGIYRNNVNVANRTTAATTLSTNKIFLASLDGASQFSVREQAFASIGSGLSAAEVANLYTAVQEYQTTLGRQV